jgi:hypothetical protein
MLEEDKARELWCPMARLTWADRKERGDGWLTTHHPAFNRVRINESTEEHLAAKCVASDCAMWRSEAVRETAFSTKEMDGWEPTGSTRGRPSGGTEAEYERTVTKGYCGLAGRPS